MQMRRLWRYTAVLLLSVLAFFGSPVPAMAVSSSPHYQVTETQFSSGANLQSCSDQYCAQATIGDTDTTPAEATSASFSSTANKEPLLEMIVEAGDSNLGVLNTEHTATKTTTIKVHNVLTGGYTLQISGDAPKFDGHTLTTLTTPTASVKGTEQFGINAVANTTPIVGANPLQTPAGQAEFGLVNDNYKTANLFMYNSGDTVGHSVIDSGQTDYTISMIVNISNSTPAGHYTGDFAAVVIPAF